MEKLILLLAGTMLKQYSAELSNNSCNDATDETSAIMSQFKEGELEKLIDEWNGEECEDGKDYDWIVAAAIGERLIKIANEN